MLRITLASLAALLATSAMHSVRADQLMAFPDLLGREVRFAATWTAMLADISPDSREGRFLHSLNGPAMPMQAKTLVGRRLLVGSVCEAAACKASSVIVVVEPATGQIYAVHRRRVDIPLRYRFLGRPDKRMQAALVREAELTDLPSQERCRR
jgi:hypothetical protein